MKIDGECLIELIRSCRNKVQVYRSVRMPQLHTSLHFHLTPIVMINGSSRQNPSVSLLRKLTGKSWNRRALILGWAYYLDAFKELSARTWLPSAIYVGTIIGTRGGAAFPARILGKGPLNALTPTSDMDELSHDASTHSRTHFNGRTTQPLEHTTP
ncbi:hypothetical protein H5410_061759 [Solanum commersonii]|uniref:Uncharacterized protein n=1 Tax=Solanum commersonii TaxID=4109 RepID=A0A9J5W8V8_SOLCO|nr:hypothetical protein H5410_061759 [Solanum commersonii]